MNEPQPLPDPSALTPTQRHILAHCRNRRFDPGQNVGKSISAYNLQCLAGMLQTGEATHYDIQAVGGNALLGAVLKIVEESEGRTDAR